MQNRWKLVPDHPLLRALLGVVVALAVITAILMVVLWPDGRRSISLGATGTPSIRAEVTRTGETCVSMPAPPCQRVSARIQNGEDRGTEVSFDVTDTVSIDVGDGVRLAATGAPPGAIGPTGQPADRYAFSDFERRVPILLFAAVFAVVLLLTTRWRGLRALGALAISLTIVVLFIVPAIAEGRSPILVALVGAMAITIATILLAYGTGVKALSAIVGTVTSLLITVAVASVATDLTRLTGRASEEVLILQAFNDPGRLSLVGLLMAGAVIGALGVLDDLTVSQASTVLALRHANPALGFGELFRRALGVGHDHIVATVNTLVLAYAGAALPTMLIFTASSTGFWDAFNSEVVAGEVVSMLIGSLGLIAAVPVTTATAAALATRLRPDAIGDVHDGHAH